ncbi:hypothetical protein NKH14_33290 [Mesorhizobium sp. M1380]|uniref:hypothetical protein n=1 Tax=Mesorhizobium sp. M1380 TaxID=2957093 RepID=UPI00333E07CF
MFIAKGGKCLVVALISFWASSALTEPAVLDPEGSGWACGAPLTIRKDQVSSLTQNSSVSVAHWKDSDLVVFAFPSSVGTKDDGSDGYMGGTAIAVRKSGAWAAYAVDAASYLQNARTSADGRHAFVFAMTGQEGPGTSYTALFTHDNFEHISCSVVEFPSELNKPTWNNEYLEFVDFNGTDRLDLIGRDENRPAGGKAANFYHYRSKDQGLHWRVAESLGKRPKPLKGIYSTLKNGDDGGLFADFLKSVN